MMDGLHVGLLPDYSLSPSLAAVGSGFIEQPRAQGFEEHCLVLDLHNPVEELRSPGPVDYVACS
jgi:hypothetical protein